MVVIPWIVRILITMLIMFGQFGPVVAADSPAAAAFLTGPKFRQELDRPLVASWTRTQLRELVQQLATSRRIAVLIDRRLDPSAEYSIDISKVTLRTGLNQIAGRANGELVALENLAYLGPKTPATKLRTLIELRRMELISKETGIPDQRRSELQRRQTFQWHDLDTPHEISSEIIKSFRLKISNTEIIPHDLWAAAVLPEVNLIEAMSVVLIQFDLTFQWTDSGRSIRLIPIPDRIFLERRHRPTQKTADAIELIHQRFPDVEVDVSNGEIIVRGLVEDHEKVLGLLRGDKPGRPNKIDSPTDIRKQLFTFNTRTPVPTSVIMKNLEESNIHFDYNADDLLEAGVDLEQMIQIDAKKMTADELFKTMFNPLGLEFQIDQQTVKLKPKKTKIKK